MSKIKVIRWPVQVYLLIMRGTPLMLQLMFFFYGPFYIFGIKGADRFTMAVVAFGLNYAAYFAEIYRGGIESIAIDSTRPPPLWALHAARNSLK